MRKYWFVSVLLIVLGTLAGVAYAGTRPTTYTAESRLAVGIDEVSSLVIPGYPTASRDLAANYARWINNTGVVGTSVPAGATIEATAIPESNVIKVVAEAPNRTLATRTSKIMTDALVKEVNKANADNDPKDILAQVTKAQPALSRAYAGSAGVLAAYQKAVVDRAPQATRSRLLNEYQRTDAYRARLEVQQEARMERYRRLVSQQTNEANLRVVKTAAVVGDDDTSRRQRYGLVGLGAGVLLALVMTSVIYRVRSRRG